MKLYLPEGAPAAPGPGGAARRAPRPKSAAHTGSGGSGTITAPMQGTIVKVTAEVGQAVSLGESVLVLEAMKMENHINTDIEGTVKEIRVVAGDTVSAGDVLVVIE